MSAVLRSVFAYEPAGLRLVGASLRALGVGLAALVGERFGGHGPAVLAAIGALYAGIASFGGVHPTRLRRMLAATLVASLTTFLGCLAQPSVPAAVATVTLGAFLLALVAEAGPDPAQVALLATGLLVVFSGLPGAHERPLGNAALVLVGGLAQVAILTLVHPLSPMAAERRAVEAVYANLGRFASARVAGRAPLPSVAPHATARDLLGSAFAYDDPPELRELWSHLELADALRGALAGLDRVGAPPETWASLARWLRSAAHASGHGRPLDRTLSEFEATPESTPWLRRIRRIVSAEGQGRLPTASPVLRGGLRTLGGVEALRHAALGHALRYALALGVATAGTRLLRLDHGYWLPLSLAFSLKPDFAGTVTKGVGRMVGTVAGVALATAVVALAHPSPPTLAVLLLGITWAAFALLNASFVGYSAALALWVVVAVTLAGAAANRVGAERIVLTLAGSALALGTAVLWPRWEAGKARGALAVAFAAQAEYADAVRAFESPDAALEFRLRARSARLEAERIVGAAALEPAWSRGTNLEGAAAALERLAENAARILAAHVAALHPEEEASPDDLARLAAEDRGLAADLMG